MSFADRPGATVLVEFVTISGMDPPNQRAYCEYSGGLWSS